MKKIKLSQNKYALVDNEDFEFLSQWKWHLNNTGYAMRSQHIPGAYKHKNILMHRVINKTAEGLQTDHRDHNPLNNQKHNLRTVTLQQNHFNMLTHKNSRSGYRGISWFNQTQKWRVRIMVSGKEIALGYYYNLKNAVLARKQAEKTYHAI